MSKNKKVRNPNMFIYGAVPNKLLKSEKKKQEFFLTSSFQAL